MFQKLINFFKDEEGATMVEYALMLALIAIVCIVAVDLIGTRASETFQSAANELPTSGG
jgi:pilus assembly protein Flp/PilA